VSLATSSREALRVIDAGTHVARFLVFGLVLGLWH
jgi:hypothetical protein